MFSLLVFLKDSFLVLPEPKSLEPFDTKDIYTVEMGNDPFKNIL